MPIKARVANRPKIDDDGFCNGTIESITDEIFEVETKDKEKIPKDQLQFSFKIDGTIKPIIVKLWTGVTISADKNWIKHSKANPEYSKLTQICIALDLFKENELLKDDVALNKDLASNLESLVGSKVRFQPIKTKSGITQVNIETLKLV